ncbi:sushi, von Willebrand factor type A, EGF and pentraxin domain-containing protein 1 isoform X3 [Tachysurus fulvidraco]|uniref:sushi, von Willebrand factor type A, EGF and pentraxin domain-containing protein 1 isoform X3 n=1 Tax=Tachysurus fulvidraco TaxID=1234273 RepID=UPI001FEE45C6|nr:sushi, von Willebrand factor type A, EGF and pentraxin domain-containing protein 1 isoform X3 [Tachysurus fulvidraco]
MEMSWWTFLLLLLMFVSRGNTGECPEPVLEGNVLLSDSALLKNTFPDGTVVNLECATGYLVDHGSDTITCVNGEWSKQELTCKKKDCGPPTPTPNMKFNIQDGTLFGAYIRVYCDRGYYLKGSSNKQCLVKGWTGRSRCLLETCEKPPEIPHSVIVSNHTKGIIEFGDVIEYRCEHNYTLVGNKSVVCQENGKYSSLPQCKGECPEPVLEGNVLLSESVVLKNTFPDGTVVNLECATGYVEDHGSDTITCINGEWSKQELTCKLVTCGKHPDIPHSVIVSNHTKGIIEFGDVIEYRCEHNYTLVGNKSVVCQENGKYSSLPQCKGECPEPVLEGNVLLMVTCGKHPDIPHSVIVSNHTKGIIEFGDVIEYRCEHNYTLVGNKSVVCQENGKYSSLPQCKGECPEPVLEGNVLLSVSVVLKNTFPDETVVNLECATGYVEDLGCNNITCINGEWSKQELTCKLVTCGKHPDIPHSVIVSNHTKGIIEFGDVIEYRCEHNYTLVGNKSVVCQENGKYSSLPQCKGECPEPVLEGNVLLSESVVLKNTFPDETVVNLECASGYVEDLGCNNITCINGEWSKQELTCKLVTCGKHPEIPHSVIVSNHTKGIIEFGDVIEYRCEHSYNLVGNKSVVCQENGKYSSLPQCEGSSIPLYLSFSFVYGLAGLAGLAGLVVLAVIVILYIYFWKRKGSYNTVEAGRSKEPLKEKATFTLY